MKGLLLFLFVLSMSFSMKASQHDLSEKEYILIVKAVENNTDFLLLSDTTVVDVQTVKFKRGKAILFTVLTGLLGGHRIYFGTHQRTPIIYSVTLGGLGILPLVDLINIIFTKDLSKFENKTQIIMWGN